METACGLTGKSYAGAGAEDSRPGVGEGESGDIGRRRAVRFGVRVGWAYGREGEGWASRHRSDLRVIIAKPVYIC